MKKYLSIIFFICILSGCQQFTSNSADKKLALRQDLIQGQLDNGMNYILVKNNRPNNRVSLQLVVHAGSLVEEDDQKGIAHLVEHMAFNGTTQFPSNSIIEHQESLGMVFGRDVNAMTEYYTTSYFLHLPNNSEQMMSEGFNMLAQQASALVFKQDELEKERPVVEEEWRRSRNMKSRLGAATREIVLSGSRFGEREPIGDMDLVRNIGADRIEAFWQDWYHPNNMTLIVVGATDKAAVENMLAKYFASMPAKELPSRPDYTVPLDNQLRVEVIKDSEITTEALSLNFREEEKVPHTESELYTKLLNEITVQVMNKRLRELYKVESDNVSKMIMISRPMGSGYRNYRLMALLTTDNYSAAADEAFSQLSRFAEHGFSAEDLATIRSSVVNTYSKAADALRDTTNRRTMMSIFNRMRMQTPYVDADEELKAVIKLTDAMTVTDVNVNIKRIVSTLNPIVIAQITPENQVKLPNDEQLSVAWEKAKLTSQQAIAGVTVTKPLMENIPQAAKVTFHIEKDGVQIWTLENGVTVRFEYSDDTPNQLLLDYRGWGGTQVLPIELRRAGLQLRQMKSFGYGGFSSDQLTILNAEYPNRIMAFVDQNRHGFNGVSDVRSLENWLQNLHLQITQPQVDAEIWHATTQLLERGIENRQKSSNGQFNSAIDAVRYVNNPEKLSLTKEELNVIGTDDLLKTWKLLFSNANGHQLNIVGNAKAEDVIRLAQIYVGTLPASSEGAFSQNELPKLGSGKHQIHIASGEEPIAVTTLIFNQELPFDKDVENEAYLLSSIISNRLRVSLRETAGGVYSVRFGVRLDRSRDQAHGLISYSHDPERGEELKSLVMAELDRLLTDGINATELEEVVVQTKHALQPDNITDRQRMKYLVSASEYGDSLTAISDYLAWVDSVKPESLNKLAQTVIKTNNWIDATLVPANFTVQ
ncbi:insulinase family protein [Vibrio sp. J1-1]|uniref:M16 family metallopeptidase n=1 Tax=Vibrio sp. J1-1 TaxID=2912251 RepID=UPI001F1FA73E|nr:M16 family metallopeptidase [Vibrio sp. J1-1]MCF7483166.1 insulinase family protein [Vibrio sp. J1-1]